MANLCCNCRTTVRLNDIKQINRIDIVLPIGCGSADGCSWPAPGCPSSWRTSWPDRGPASAATAQTWVAMVSPPAASIRCTRRHSCPRTLRRTCSSPVRLPAKTSHRRVKECRKKNNILLRRLPIFRTPNTHPLSRTTHVFMSMAPRQKYARDIFLDFRGRQKKNSFFLT